MLLAAILLLATPAEPPVTELEYVNARMAQLGLPAWTQEQLEKRNAYSKRFALEYEGNRLRGAGFVAAAELRASGRSLVRASYAEPRLFIRMPGVTLERLDDGRLTVTLSSDGRAARGTAPASAEDWRSLQALEAAAFAPDPPPAPAPWLSWKRGDPLPPAPQSVCHGWGVTLERISPGEASKTDAHECQQGPLAKARLAYGERLAEIALKAFPSCKAKADGRDLLQDLASCFGTFDPATSANP